MLPTGLGIGEGWESRQPMAIAVSGGMLTSTVLSLPLVPVFYEIIDAFEQRIRPRLTRLVAPRWSGDDDPLPGDAPHMVGADQPIRGARAALKSCLARSGIQPLVGP